MYLSRLLKFPTYFTHWPFPLLRHILATVCASLHVEKGYRCLNLSDKFISYRANQHNCYGLISSCLISIGKPKTTATTPDFILRIIFRAQIPFKLFHEFLDNFCGGNCRGSVIQIAVFKDGDFVVSHFFLLEGSKILNQSDTLVLIIYWITKYIAESCF